MITVTPEITKALNLAQAQVGVSDDAHLDIVDALVFITENPEFEGATPAWSELVVAANAHGCDPLACFILEGE